MGFMLDLESELFAEGLSELRKYVLRTLPSPSLSVVGCGVYFGSGPLLSLVDLRVEGLRLAKEKTALQPLIWCFEG